MDTRSRFQLPTAELIISVLIKDLGFQAWDEPFSLGSLLLPEQLLEEGQQLKPRLKQQMSLSASFIIRLSRGITFHLSPVTLTDSPPSAPCNAELSWLQRKGRKPLKSQASPDLATWITGG